MEGFLNSTKAVKTTDPGHEYHLRDLDGTGVQRLRFVKRFGSKFPGNTSAYPGTTSQAVIRCLIDRTRYLQLQLWAIENVFILQMLRIVLWLFEFRAARRHGIFYWKSLSFAETAAMCKTCHHTVCNCD